jgi:hypothetical protein
MEKELPLYKLVISDTEDSVEEVDFVALVERPAIQKNFIAFNNRQKFFADNEERVVSGPLMIADMPIYRRDEQLGEYYVMFTGEEIKKIVQRFFRFGYQSNVNIEHTTPVEGVFMFESYLIDRKKGKMPMAGFEDVVDGSWWGSYKINNEEIWAEVKSGTFKGFSVEGIFKYMKVKDIQMSAEVELLNQIKNILSQIEH